MIALAFGTICSPAIADEGYEFYQFTCPHADGELRFEPVVIWNIGNRVWGSKWSEHIQKLKKLETDHQLYVFGRAYGYYDKSEIVFECGTIVARLTYELFQLKYEDEETARELRDKPFIWFYTHDGELIASQRLPDWPEDSPRAYAVRLHNRQIDVYEVETQEDASKNPTWVEAERDNDR